MYIVPKDGATVTIFAPYDCNNNCPFCINKKDYKDNPTFDMNKVIKSMEVMNKITPNCDFVITGGEPLASIHLLERILMTIEFMNLRGANHKVFINTTLPVEKKDIYILNKWKNVITGLNISRHVKDYVVESNDILLSYLKIPVRINCVLYTQEEATYAHEVVDRFKDFPIVNGIQFRDNYVGVKFDNLYNMESNKILKELLKSFNKTIDECEFHYSSFRWDCQIAPNIKFHRTMCYSKLTYNKIVDEYNNPLENMTEINDVIINPRGDILDDWNEHGEILDLAQYKEGIKRK